MKQQLLFFIMFLIQGDKTYSQKRLLQESFKAGFSGGNTYCCDSGSLRFYQGI